MAVNSANQDDGKYNTGSSQSVIASRATLKAQDVIAASVLSTDGTLTVGGAATFLAGFAGSTSTATFLATNVGAGVAIAPTRYFTSEVSLGLYRSAVSQIAQSYGTFNTAAAGGIAFNRLALQSSSTTAQSGATAKLGDGQLYFSVLSLTSNGGEFGFRSGNTVYRFSSTLVG